MSRILLKPSAYRDALLRAHVFDMMEALVPDSIRSGARVLIKPNFLVPAGPETAVVTHPLITRAVVEYVLEKGALPQISDSPAMGSFERVLRESGTREALKGLPVVCKPFETSRSVDIGPPFGRIDIAEDALSADVIINLPKLKTHNLTGLTLGVKNLFGCIVGLKKPEWHVRMGTNVEMLCRLFVLIHERLRPAMTLLDGIMALEGQGPGRSGTPRHVGLLMGSTDTYALDEAACHLVGADPGRLPISRCVREMGLMKEPMSVRQVIRDAGCSVENFHLPGAGGGVTAMYQGLARKVFLSKPVVNPQRCNLCAACREICPACALSIDDRRLSFDYDRCIRCYCCTEVCPQGALGVRESVPGRLVKKIRRLSHGR